MKVWLVNPYGTLPSEGWREYRSSLLARALAERGHKVVWWISDIEHRSKSRRSREIVEPSLPSSIEIQCLRSRAYQRNIGPGRILYERSFGRAFARAATELAPADIIVLVSPSLFFQDSVEDVANRTGARLVVDVLDLWPELFEILLPKSVRHLGRFIFHPLYQKRNNLIRRSAGVAAVTRDYLDKVLADVSHDHRGAFYLGTDLISFQDNIPTASAPDPARPFTLIYAGTLGEAYDLKTVIEAITLLLAQNGTMRVLFAGDGPGRILVQSLAQSYPANVTYLGSLPAEDLLPFYQSSDVGICSYQEGSTVSMPVKFFDYLAAGLAVLTSLDGEIRTHVESGCGLWYKPGAPQDLAAAISTLTEDHMRLSSCRRAAARLAERFDSRQQHAAFARFLEQLSPQDRQTAASKAQNA